MSLKNKKYLLLVGLIAVTSVVASISLSYLSYAKEAKATITIDEIKAPKALLGAKNVSLQYQLKLTNSGATDREIGLSLDCGKEPQWETYKQKPGTAKQVFNYTLATDELLAINATKTNKKTILCTLKSEEGQEVSFDLYKNKIKVDIKNVKGL